jgi:hypothetical protein
MLDFVQGLKVEPQTLLDVSGAVPDSVTQSLLQACRTKTVSSVQTAITDAIADGWGVRACFPTACVVYCRRQLKMYLG